MFETRAEIEEYGDIDAIILCIALFDMIGNDVTFAFDVNEVNAEAVAVAVEIAVNCAVIDTKFDTLVETCAETDDKADIIGNFDIIGWVDTVAIALQAEMMGLVGIVNGDTIPVKYAESGTVPIGVRHA